MTRLSAIFGRFCEGLAVVAAATLLGMVMLVTADIVLRNTAGLAIAWANEVTEYALYLSTLLTAPWLLRRGQHVRLDLVLTLVPQRIAWLLEAAADIAGFIVCMILLRYGAIMVFEAYRLHTITIKILLFPEWWILAPFPVTMLLLAIEFNFRFHRLLQDRTRRQEATSVG